MGVLQQKIISEYQNGIAKISIEYGNFIAKYINMEYMNFTAKII